MSRVFDSVDAFIAHKQPAHPCQCGILNWQFMSESAEPHISGLELRLGWYACKSCKDETDRYFYINRRDTLWTAEQVKGFRAARQRKDWSLKDVTAYTGISVSRLSDFERRLAGATDTEIAALQYFDLLPTDQPEQPA